MNRKIFKTLLGVGVVSFGMVLASSPARALYVGTQVLFGGDPGTRAEINFAKGSGSYIYDDWDLHVQTDDRLHLNAPHGVLLSDPTLRFAGSSAYLDLGGNSKITRAEDLKIETDDYLYLTGPTATYWDTELVKFAGGYSTLTIDFNKNGSQIVNGDNLSIVTSNNLSLEVGAYVAIDKDLKVGGGYGNTGATISSAGNISMDGNLTVGGSIAGTATVSTLSVTGASTFAGASTFNGAVTLGNAVGDDITVTGYVASDLLPKTDDTYSLGASGREWKNLFVDGTANLDEVTIAGATSITGATSIIGALTQTGNYTLTGILDVDYTANLDEVVIAGDLLITPRALSSGTAEGTIYYDSTDDNLYVYANGAFVDLTAGATGTASFDDIYNAETGQHTIVGDNGSMSWDMSSTYDFIVDIQGTGNFIVQDNGTAVFTVADGGAATLKGALTVGENDTGYDVKFFGATAGASWLWDESANAVIITGVAGADGLQVAAGNTNLDGHRNETTNGASEARAYTTLFLINPGLKIPRPARQF